MPYRSEENQRKADALLQAALLRISKKQEKARKKEAIKKQKSTLRKKSMARTRHVRLVKQRKERRVERTKRNAPIIKVIPPVAPEIVRKVIADSKPSRKKFSRANLYSPPERFVFVNETDPDLKPIQIPLPEPPKEDKVIGFGMLPKEQVWRRFPLPKKLKELEKKCASIDECYKMLRQEPEFYSEEIEYVQTEWKRRKEGLWIYINGMATYIPGKYYMYLNHWHLDVGYPDYRSRDRKFFLFFDFVECDIFSCGFNYPKFRREGATSKAAFLNYEKISRTPFAHGGIQSMSEDHAEHVFQKHIVAGWRRMPFFFKPVYEGKTNPKRELNFFAPSQIVGKDNDMLSASRALDSWIDFGSAEKGYYDTYKLQFHHGDEVGKSLSLDTEVLMYDGAVKKIQDVVIGDLMMGDDSTPRTVLDLGRGQEQMYEIIVIQLFYF